MSIQRYSFVPACALLASSGCSSANGATEALERTSAATMGAPAADAPPLIPRRLVVQGRGILDVADVAEDLHWRFQGGFRMAVAKDDVAGTLQVVSLSLELDDTTVTIPGVFHDTTVYAVAGQVTMSGQPAATLDTATGAWRVGSSRFHASAFKARDAERRPIDPLGVLDGVSSGAALTLDESARTAHVAIAPFSSVVGGETLTASITLDGAVVLGPPTGGGGFATSLQGGECPRPAIVGYDKAGPIYRNVLEMNAPDGWHGELASNAYHPYGLVIDDYYWALGVPGGTDLASYNGNRVHVDLAPARGLRLYHAATDTTGAAAASYCDFDVRDTTPPAVSASAKTVECTSPAGTSASDPIVASWLATTGAATDVVDSSPARSVVIASGPVTSSTVFPLGATPITFSATDASGNRGSANATLTVVDTTPPTGKLKLSSSWFPEDHAAVDYVDLYASSSDLCGSSTASLSRVTSNYPAWDAYDVEIVSATRVRLGAWLTPSGAPRVYTIVLQLRDAAGNVSSVSNQVTIGR